MSDCIHLDRQADAFISMNEFCNCIEQVSEIPGNWKFALIAIHNALQGYICIALRKGNSFQTWNDRSLKKWMEAYENDAPLPSTKLTFFMDLYDKAFSTVLVIERKDIEWLNKYRNNLVHFNVDGLSFKSDSALKSCKAALAAIKLTPSLASGIFFYKEERKKNFEEICKKAESLLAVI